MVSRVLVAFRRVVLCRRMADERCWALLVARLLRMAIDGWLVVASAIRIHRGVFNDCCCLHNFCIERRVYSTTCIISTCLRHDKRTCMYVDAHAQWTRRICVRIRTCTYTYVYVCTCTCVRVYVCTCVMQVVCTAYPAYMHYMYTIY